MATESVKGEPILSDCGSFIQGSSNFLLFPVPWLCFAGGSGFARLKEYYNLGIVNTDDQLSVLSARRKQWEFLSKSSELESVLLNREEAFSHRLKPKYLASLPTLTKLSRLQPPPLLGESKSKDKSLLSSDFIQREKSQSEIERDNRLINVHGVTVEQMRLNKLISRGEKEKPEKDFLNRDEKFQTAFPVFSVPGRKYSHRTVIVKKFSELIYQFIDLEKDEKDLPKDSFKFINRWIKLTGQTEFSEKRRLILSHSFGVSWNMIVMLLQFVKKIDDLVKESGVFSSTDVKNNYTKLMSGCGYLADLTRQMQDFHNQFFTNTTWNSFTGQQKCALVTRFYRTMSMVSNPNPVMYSESSLLNFAPTTVAQLWRPLFLQYLRGSTKSKTLSGSNITKEHEILTNSKSTKSFKSKPNIAPKKHGSSRTFSRNRKFHFQLPNRRPSYYRNLKASNRNRGSRGRFQRFHPYRNSSRSQFSRYPPNRQAAPTQNRPPNQRPRRVQQGRPASNQQNSGGRGRGRRQNS